MGVTFPGMLLLLIAWRRNGSSKGLAALILAGLLLRIVVGIGMNHLLPAYGYDQPVQKAGYLFRDAQVRDNEAWSLSKASDLGTMLTTHLGHDQYGGLAYLSAFIYRYLSPDAHRPGLVMSLGAFVFSFGLAFFYGTINRRWGRGLALLASWITAVYPDSILFMASQMREPFLVGLGMLAFSAIMRWRSNPVKYISLFLLCLVLMLPISYLITAMLAAFLFGLVAIDYLLPKYKGPPALLWIGAGAAVGLTFVIGWVLFNEYMQWDLVVTMRDSGWVSKVITEMGEQYRFPFITIYGLAQPVLPAAIAEPAIPLWKTIAIIRSLGWYALAPLLLYGIFKTLTAAYLVDRGVWSWLAGFVLVWLVVASVRAGGDIWDNPRYRTNFIPYLALLAAWAIRWALANKDGWLLRWLLIEAIFLAYFTNWYFSRYYLIWNRLPFARMVLEIIVLTVFVLISGAIWGLIQRRRKLPTKKP